MRDACVRDCGRHFMRMKEASQRSLVLAALAVFGLWLFGSSLAEAADPATPGQLTLPASAAWKEISWSGGDPNPFVLINLVDKNRWRVEVKDTAVSTVLVVVFDGTQLAASNPKAPKSLDPHLTMGKIFKDLGQAQMVGVEERDGHHCWHYNLRETDLTEDIWVDIQTRFPVHLEGVFSDGSRVRGQYTLLKLDLAGGKPRYFDTGSTEPLFEPSLVP
jgi:hypothetical protein